MRIYEESNICIVGDEHMLKYIYSLFNKNMKRTFIFLFMSIVIGSILSVYPIILIRNIVDLAVGGMNNNIYTIINVGILYLILQIFRATLMAYVNFSSQSLQAKISYQSRINLFDNLNKTKIEAIKDSNSSYLSSTLIQDTEYVSNNIIEPFTELITSVFMFIFGFYFMAKINVLLTLFILPLGLLSSLVIRYISGKLCKNVKNQREISAAQWKTYSEGILGFIPIRLHNYSKKYMKKICDTGSELRDNQIYQGKLESLSYFFTSSLFMITIGLILILSSIFVIKNRVTIGGLTAILMYNHMLTDPLLKMLEINEKIIRLKVSLERIIKIMSLPKDEYIYKCSNIDEFCMTNVSYIRREKQVILENINLHARTPMSMAILGPTGCGKSTLVNIIAGIYNPSEGTIIYKKDNEVMPYKPKVSYMLQDEFLFDDSIVNNILIGNQFITDIELKEIISMCELDEVIKLHCNKPIGENGCNLSGGERKRVQLARTLANDVADMYIFDELSASLDRETFLRICKKVDKRLKDKIRIYIDHNNDIKNVVEYVIYIDNHTSKIKI